MKITKKREERLESLLKMDRPLWESGIVFAGIDEADAVVLHSERRERAELLLNGFEGLLADAFISKAGKDDLRIRFHGSASWK